jgi:hypothetical protein
MQGEAGRHKVADAEEVKDDGNGFADRHFWP